MTRSSVPALVVCALAGAISGPAQDITPAYTPLTLEQNYDFTLSKTVSWAALCSVVTRASFEQWRDRPHQWGSDADAFAMRAASAFGRTFIRQNLAFGVRALDGEDPRYFPSERDGGWNRSRDAVTHTFMTRNHSGKWIPAYSLLVSSFATPFLVNEWRPDRRRMPHELAVGCAGLGFGISSSMWQEFWPDVKRKLHRLP